ncbi:hypothetical protein EIP86_006613 [Pleurotus ostreatoroseus]|nr:hypothetical protein EIP86_006613 [Pleurotus ostreatoroseus]
MDGIDELVIEEMACPSRKSQSLVAVGDSKWSESSKNEERPVTYTTKDLDEPEKFDDMSYARIGLILFSLGLCTFLYAIEQTIVSTSVSSIAAGTKATGSLTWITTSYLLTTTVIQPLAGRLTEVFGTKRMLLAEVWIFIFGNIIAGTAHNIKQLVAGRLIAGVGGAGLMSLCTIIVSQLTHERQRSSYLNLINVVFIIADSTGPVLGGILAKSGNWRWIFLLNAPLGPLITAILIYSVHIKHLPKGNDIRTTIRSLDLLGMGLIISWLTLFIIALNLGGDAYAWGSPVIIGLFVGAGCAFIAFIVAENYATNPVVPMGLFVSWKTRNVPIMTVFLQVTGKPSILAAALVIPFLFTAALASTISNQIAAKYDIVRPTFLIGQVILPIGMGLMSTLDATNSVGQVVGYTIICGFGFGAGTTTSMVIPQAGLPPDLLPTVTAFISATPNLGGVLGVGIVGTIINNQFRTRLAALAGTTNVPANVNDAVAAAQNPLYGAAAVSAYVDAFQLGFRVLAGVAAFQFALCLLLGRVVLHGSSATKEQSDDDIELQEANVSNTTS